MGACSKCECPYYFRKKKRKPGSARRCTNCQHLKNFHDQPEPEPSSEDDSGEDDTPVPAKKLAIAADNEAGGSASVKPFAEPVTQRSAPVVASILGRYWPGATAGPASSLVSTLAPPTKSSTTRLNASGPLAAIGPALPVTAASEALKGWRDRKKAADSGTSSSAAASRSKGKSSGSSKGKERERVRKSGFLVVFTEPGVEWDINDTSLPVPTVVPKITAAEIQTLANQGFALIDTSNGITFRPSMSASELVDWVWELLPAVHHAYLDRIQEFSFDRSPLVLLQKNRNKLLLFREPHPSGSHLNMVVAGADQAWYRNGVFMAFSLPITGSGSEGSPSQHSFPRLLSPSSFIDDTWLDENATSAATGSTTLALDDQDGDKIREVGHKSRQRSASPEPRRSKRLKRRSQQSAGSAPDDPLFIQGSSDEATSASASASNFIPNSGDESDEGRQNRASTPPNLRGFVAVQHPDSLKKVKPDWKNDFL